VNWQARQTVLKEEERVKEIEAQIADLKKRWPAHSVPPNMLMQLDELEDELEEVRQSLARALAEEGTERD